MIDKSLTITIYRGDSYSIPFTLTDKTTGQPIPLAGAVLTLTVDERSDPTDISTQLFQLNGELSDTPEDGKVLFTPSIINTARIGQFYYDVQLAQGGTIRTILKSKFIIDQDITK